MPGTGEYWRVLESTGVTGEYECQVVESTGEYECQVVESTGEY